MRLSKLLSKVEMSAANQAPTFITFYDASRQVIGKVQRARPERLILQAQLDRAQMDKFKADNPRANQAIVDGWENLPFAFDEYGFSYSSQRAV